MRHPIPGIYAFYTELNGYAVEAWVEMPSTNYCNSYNAIVGLYHYGRPEPFSFRLSIIIPNSRDSIYTIKMKRGGVLTIKVDIFHC